MRAALKSWPVRQELDAATTTAELDERTLQALRAENGPFEQGRELAVVARACLAELRRTKEGTR